jgi:hypothetical protein
MDPQENSGIFWNSKYKFFSFKKSRLTRAHSTNATLDYFVPIRNILYALHNKRCVPDQCFNQEVSSLFLEKKVNSLG